MRNIKKLIGQLFFGTWLVIFIVHYAAGSRGLVYGWRAQRENANLVQRVAQLQSEIAHLHEQVSAWQTDRFYLQRLAREQLQLARDGDTVYYVTQ